MENPKELLLYLYTNKGITFKVSYKELSKNLGIPQSTLKRWLKELIKLGYIERVKRGLYSLTRKAIYDVSRTKELVFKTDFEMYALNMTLHLETLRKMQDTLESFKQTLLAIEESHKKMLEEYKKSLEEMKKIQRRSFLTLMIAIFLLALSIIL